MLARIPAKNADALYPYVEAEDLLRGAIELFALYPHLPKHLLDLIARHKVREGGFSVFNYILVGAADEAMIAEDYRVSYRLRTAEELHLASTAKDFDSVIFGTHKITPAMVEAGIDALLSSFSDEWLSWRTPGLAHAVTQVFRAMEQQLAQETNKVVAGSHS